MPRLHRDERPAKRGADFAAGPQLRLDDSPIVGDLDRPRDQLDRTIRRCRANEPHGELGRDRRRRSLRVVPPHEVVGRRPVRVAVEKSSGNAAGKDTIECLVMLRRVPDGDDLIAAYDTLDAQTLPVDRPTSKADPAGVIPVLERLILHAARLIGRIDECTVRGGERASSTRSIPARSKTRTGTASATSP